MPWIVQLTGYDKVAAQEKTVIFAQGEGVAFTDAAYAASAVQRWASPTQSIAIGSAGMVETSSSQGEVVLVNVPNTSGDIAPLDAMADWIWQNRPVSLYYVPGKAWAARILVATGILEQPIAKVSMGGSYSSSLTFPIRDPRAALATPLQPNKFLGTNVGPAGVEGDESLKGKPKPIIYGLVSNISPPLVNSSLLIYQIADVSVNVLCVRDGGVSLALGTVRANLASMQAGVPAGGTYDVLKLATGTYIKLGSFPIYGISVDADEASSVANQSHANIWSRFRTQRASSTVNAASVTAANALDSYGAGFYWGADTTDKAALDEILGSFSGYEVQNLDGSWSVFKLVIPSGAPALEFVVMSPTVKMKATSRIMKDLTKVRPAYADDGSPPYRVNVNWGRNYTVMSENNFAGVVSQRLRSKFSQEYRVASAIDATIWNPDTQTGAWKNAPEMTINAAYQPDADGIGATGPQTEAQRILDLLSPMRNHFQMAFNPKPQDYLTAGMVVSLTHPRMGLATTKLFRILQAGFILENEKPTADVVVGFQV